MNSRLSDSIYWSTTIARLAAEYAVAVHLEQVEKALGLAKQIEESAGHLAMAANEGFEVL